MKELSGGEWNVMESLWESFPKVGSQIVADMASRVGWSRSTTLTMLRRMTDKGLISCVDNGKMKSYSPLVEREAAVRRETENFINRVYHGSVSMLVNGFVEKSRLSAQEIRQLREILDRAQSAWGEGEKLQGETPAEERPVEERTEEEDSKMSADGRVSQ